MDIKELQRKIELEERELLFQLELTETLLNTARKSVAVLYPLPSLAMQLHKHAADIQIAVSRLDVLKDILSETENN